MPGLVSQRCRVSVLSGFRSDSGWPGPETVIRTPESGSRVYAESRGLGLRVGGLLKNAVAHVRGFQCMVALAPEPGIVRA